MATLVPLSTPARQPFGALNTSKLRNLQSIKNRQNAIAPNSAPSLKRRAPSPENSDSENVDPNILDSFGKRKRSNFDDDISSSKQFRHTLQVAKPRSAAPTIAVTPRLDTCTKPVSVPPLSAPPAAGRSPTRGKSKSLGLLKSASSKRFQPLAFGGRSPSLSIATALNGTLASKKARRARTLEDSKPKSWFFDIYEENEETQNYRMNEWTMTQSATGLDISDDEAKGKAVAEEAYDRGKENVDPSQLFEVPVTRSMAAANAASLELKEKDLMTDYEPRTPLGALNAADFYGEGLDATSVVLVHDDSDASDTVPIVAEETQGDFTFESKDKLPARVPVPSTSWEADISIDALLAASVPVWTEQGTQVVQVAATEPSELTQTRTDAEPIEIWESESAKGEDDNHQDGGCVQIDEGEVFALQEL